MWWTVSGDGTHSVGGCCCSSVQALARSRADPIQACNVADSHRSEESNKERVHRTLNKKNDTHQSENAWLVASSNACTRCTAESRSHPADYSSLDVSRIAWFSADKLQRGLANNGFCHIHSEIKGKQWSPRLERIPGKDRIDRAKYWFFFFIQNGLFIS